MKDILLLSGLGLLAIGCYLHYPPLSAIVCGSILFATGTISHFYAKRK